MKSSKNAFNCLSEKMKSNENSFDITFNKTHFPTIHHSIQIVLCFILSIIIIIIINFNKIKCK